MPELIVCIDRRDFPADIPHPFYLPDTSPLVFCGDSDLFALKRTAILNSRQSPRLSLASKWIEQTLAVLRQYDPRKTALVSSLGLTTWDFLTWAGGRMGFALILVFPAGSAQNFNVARTKAILDLGLGEARVLALRPVRVSCAKSLEADSAVRDRWIMALSHRLVPISIRPRGHFEKYLSHTDLDANHIERSGCVAFERPNLSPKPLIPRNIQVPASYRADEYLIHWTRSCIGPWPGESRHAYFGRVMEGKEDPNSGLEALQRILREGEIRASGRLIRGGVPVVPFTEAPPEDLSKLISYRSGLRRWTLEAYGVALKKRRLIELGARPVLYGAFSDFEKLEARDQPFFQVADSRSGNWREEREWRIPGNVSLGSFAVQEIVLFVPSESEVLQLGSLSPFKAIPLSSN